MTSHATERPIEDFSAEGPSLVWQIVNDGVMGGRSQSQLAPSSDGVVRFHGNLSLENNGGFASVRGSGKMPDLTGVQAIVIRAKGDGRSYQFRLRTSTGWRAPSYSTTFQTEVGQWQTIVLPLENFRAVWRGRAVPDAPPLDITKTRELGILLGDGQPGEFALEIEWIKATSLDKLKT